MIMKYYRLTDDINFPGRWYLDEVVGVDNWALAEGKIPTGSRSEFTLQIYKPGRQMDFTLTEVYGIPVVSNLVKNVLVDLPGLKFLFVRVKGNNSSSFFLMLIEKKLDCVDEKQSEFEKFETNDSIRPDKAGQYKGFFKLVIDKTKAAGTPIFRLAGFDVAIIVNADVKRILDAASVTGTVMSEV